MGKLQLNGLNLGLVFNFRNGRVHKTHFLCCGVELLNLKLNTQPRQLFDSLLLNIALPDNRLDLLLLVRYINTETIICLGLGANQGSHFSSLNF
jgi:hypothetical protein